MSAASADTWLMPHHITPSAEPDLARHYPAETARIDLYSTPKSRTGSSVSTTDVLVPNTTQRETMPCARTGKRSTFLRKASNARDVAAGTQPMYTVADQSENEFGVARTKGPGGDCSDKDDWSSSTLLTESNRQEKCVQVDDVSPSRSPMRHRKSSSISALKMMLGRGEPTSRPPTTIPMSPGSASRRRAGPSDSPPSSWLSKLPHGRRRMSSTTSRSEEQSDPQESMTTEAIATSQGDLYPNTPSTSKTQTAFSRPPYSLESRSSALLSSARRKSAQDLSKADDDWQHTSSSYTSAEPAQSPSSERRAFFARSKRAHTVGSKERPQVSMVDDESLGMHATDADFNPVRSTDSLHSTVTTQSTKNRLFRRTGEIMSKAASLQRWNRNSHVSVTSNENSDSPLKHASPSPKMEPFELITSHQSSSRSRTNLSDTSEGLRDDRLRPKKIGGWVTNMRGSRNRTSDAKLLTPAAHSQPFKEYKGLLRGASSQRAMHGEMSDSSAQAGSQGHGATKLRTSLLSSLASSGLIRGETGSEGSGARSGLDRALRYFMDSGEQENGLGEGIWLLGVLHGPREAPSHSYTNSQASGVENGVAQDDAVPPASTGQEGPTFDARTAPRVPSSDPLTPTRATSDPTTSFHEDFSSRVWCTYRSHFSAIARDGSITAQAAQAAAQVAMNPQEDVEIHSSESALRDRHESSEPALVEPDTQIGSALNNTAVATLLGERMGIPNLWNRATAMAQAYGFTGRSGLTTDAGWGCMLRTGQSLLANALLSVHLGRAWRRTSRPPQRQIGHPEESLSSESQTKDSDRERYARYVRILSWFMDDPSSACPFSVHRMAREGKRLGKEVGEWFGPSTAAGAIQRLVELYPACGLGVNVASDGVVYLDQVRAEARRSDVPGRESSAWARQVLILIGIRLGLDGVHPMYHDSVKATFAFPHSVGIAGGRPSSSYYFVGYQGNSLFYLDPHHVRSAIHFKHPPPDRVDDDDWWLEAYGEQELETFHNDRPRRMPVKSLDPSMLLGFLIEDEDSFSDFANRVKTLARPIFSVQESMPRWMTTDDASSIDEEAAIESISESSGDQAAEASYEPAEVINGRDSDIHDVDTQQYERPADLVRSQTATSSATLQSDGAFELVDGSAAKQMCSTAEEEEDAIAFPAIGNGSTSQLSVGSQHPTINSADTSRRNTEHRALTPRPASALAPEASANGADRGRNNTSSGTEDPSERSFLVLQDRPDVRRSSHHARNETLSSNYSVVSGSDAGSTWEELQQNGADSGKKDSVNPHSAHIHASPIRDQTDSTGHNDERLFLPDAVPAPTHGSTKTSAL